MAGRGARGSTRQPRGPAKGGGRRRAAGLGRTVMAVLRRELLLAAVVAATAALGAAALWAVKPHRAPARMAAAAFQADAAEPLRSDVPSASSLAAAVRSFIPADPVPIAAPALRAPGDAPAWQRNAVAAIDAGGRPMIAVVID